MLNEEDRYPLLLPVCLHLCPWPRLLTRGALLVPRHVVAALIPYTAEDFEGTESGADLF